MFDIGWTELLVIGIVALIVVGPKDLPGMFRALGKFTAKARNLAREFQRAMDAAADESGVKDVASDLKKAANPSKMGLDAVKDAANKFEKWQPDFGATKSSSPKPGSETAKLTEERAAQAAKIREAAAEKALARQAAEKAASEAPEPAPEAEPNPAPAPEDKSA